jgi:hypothetical protein
MTIKMLSDMYSTTCNYIASKLCYQHLSLVLFQSCMSDNDVLAALSKEPLGERYYLILEKIVKSAPLSSHSIEDLKVLHSRVSPVEGRQLSLNLLDQVFLGLDEDSELTAWDIAVLLLSRVKVEGNEPIVELVDQVSLIPQAVYDKHRIEILDFFNLSPFKQSITAVQANLILSKIQSRSLDQDWGILFRFLHNAESTEGKFTITTSLPWNQLSANDLLGLLQDGIVTETSPLFIWLLFSGTLHSRIRTKKHDNDVELLTLSSFGGHDAALRLISKIVKMVQTCFDTRSDDHDKEVIIGCLLTLQVLQLYLAELEISNADMEIGIIEKDVRAFISPQIRNYFYLSHFHASVDMLSPSKCLDT